uniref:Uncharacterized protein n=1 Tax=viral metagenome TaxID=1070528 RepID=A0A6M3X6I2_9ZZZZ
MKLKKKLRITAFDPKGRMQEVFETDNVEFRKDGTMTHSYSTIFHSVLDSVVEGGAIFIERFWGIE